MPELMKICLMVSGENLRWIVYNELIISIAPLHHYQSESSRMSSSTSPSPPHNMNGHHSGAVRRPPRKSTLTQQQKNMKRQRATQDQLSLLEVEFNKNPTPTAIVRDRIAQEINMTPRSVQIWFQNR